MVKLVFCYYELLELTIGPGPGCPLMFKFPMGPVNCKT